jgi:hypothetical protein
MTAHGGIIVTFGRIDWPWQWKTQRSPEVQQPQKAASPASQGEVVITE